MLGKKRPILQTKVSSSHKFFLLGNSYHPWAMYLSYALRAFSCLAVWIPHLKILFTSISIIWISFLFVLRIFFILVLENAAKIQNEQHYKLYIVLRIIQYKLSMYIYLPEHFLLCCMHLLNCSSMNIVCSPWSILL